MECVIDVEEILAERELTWARRSPKTSSFFFRGVSSSSAAASVICCWMAPTSVDIPMALTIPLQPPFATAVPANSMQSCHVHNMSIMRLLHLQFLVFYGAIVLACASERPN